MEQLSWIHAIIMGIVQGLTEFLPVSSSGHLVLAKFMIGADASLNTSALFEILLHVGTLAAVCVVYFRDVVLLIKEGLLLIRDGVLWLVHGGKRKFEMYRDRKMVLLVIVASIPTAILGLVMQKFLEDLFLSSVMAVGFALLLTGGMLLASAKIPAGKKRLEKASYRDAVVIGLFQGVATIPGISRSGSTIVGGMLCGFDREFAIRFSFLISMPAIGGAAILKLSSVSGADLELNWFPYLLGAIVAAIVGYACIRGLLAILKGNKFHYFGFYCLAVGLLAVVWGFLH